MTKTTKPSRTIEESLDKWWELVRPTTLRLIEGKPPVFTGNDRVAGTVHAGAYALAFFYSACAGAYMAAAFLERWVVRAPDPEDPE